MTGITIIEHPEQFIDELTKKPLVMLIDQNVGALYEEMFDGYDKIIVPSGEQSKHISLIGEIMEILLDMGFTKDSYILGVGGGVVTDITGLAAALYMRGVQFGFMPTSLLAMCDAAIGGKNGVNCNGIKNIIGTIRQPDAIAVWPDFLKTLPDIEFRNGMAEVIKHALLAGEQFIDFLINHKDEITGKKLPILSKMIKKSAELKLSIVIRDEHDRHLRHLLNFGHTIGHALETATGLPHGECVAAGMNIDARIALHLGICNSETVNIIHHLTELFGLPTHISFSAEQIMNHIEGDKKRNTTHIRYPLPQKAGDFTIAEISMTELKKLLKHAEQA